MNNTSEIMLTTVPLSAFLVAVVAGFVGFCLACAPRNRWAQGGAGAGLALLSIGCFAPVVPVPYAFTNGTPADATEVNSNFNSITQQLDDLLTTVEALQQQVDTHVADNAIHLNGNTLDGNLTVTGTVTAATYTFPTGGNISSDGAGVSISSAGSSVSVGVGIFIQSPSITRIEGGGSVDIDGGLITLN